MSRPHERRRARGYAKRDRDLRTRPSRPPVQLAAPDPDPLELLLDERADDTLMDEFPDVAGVPFDWLAEPE